jgi:hypothetical protein
MEQEGPAVGHVDLALDSRFTGQQHLAPEHLRSAVSRLDSVMVPGGSGRNRAEQVETLIASK